MNCNENSFFHQIIHYEIVIICILFDEVISVILAAMWAGILFSDCNQYFIRILAFMYANAMIRKCSAQRHIEDDV